VGTTYGAVVLDADNVTVIHATDTPIYGTTVQHTSYGVPVRLMPCSTYTDAGDMGVYVSCGVYFCCDTCHDGAAGLRKVFRDDPLASTYTIALVAWREAVWRDDGAVWVRYIRRLSPNEARIAWPHAKGYSYTECPLGDEVQDCVEQYGAQVDWLL